MIISYPELVTHAHRNAHMHIHDGQAHYTKNIIDVHWNYIFKRIYATVHVMQQ